MSISNSIPTEVVIRIFGELSLSDALHLAATCCRLRQVLNENTPTVYKRLRRQIQCERYARVLLADQGGLPSNSPSVTIPDLLRLRRNSRMVEKAINVFDRDITPHIRIPTTDIDDEFYGGKPRPLHLTPTERHRFTRSYYQVWSLFLLDRPSRQQRYRSMLLKHLYVVFEMIDLDQPIADEASPPTEKRGELLREVDVYLCYLYHRIHRQDYINFSGQSISMRTQGHAAIWDHCQPDFKKVVCYPWRNPDKLPIQDEEVWEYTTDEE
ncbi:uncharacterized protein N7459_009445 [Penicillium hispanicum]|uniref:uncharacterized protein n=1 Tax=Penicillium hispanicum TaxID=1080232 RepID=UPI0025425994|nr:uncharacterized protein N7459_009445 [Penicillium hispanicum]KAJ5570015.1 hypothetical protein N7459_009445 [Penicillium hispanicum]